MPPSTARVHNHLELLPPLPPGAAPAHEVGLRGRRPAAAEQPADDVLLDPALAALDCVDPTGTILVR